MSAAAEHAAAIAENVDALAVDAYDTATDQGHDVVRGLVAEAKTHLAALVEAAERAERADRVMRVLLEADVFYPTSIAQAKRMAREWLAEVSS